MPGQAEPGATALVWTGEGHWNRHLQGCWALPCARPPLTPSGPAIPSDMLVALCSLCCSAAQVVCIPHAGATSDIYCPPPGPCLLGSCRSLVTCLGLAVLVTTVSERNWGVCMFLCVSECVCSSVWMSVCVQGSHVSAISGDHPVTTINVCSCCSSILSLVILT